ncbi:TAXI family TRAP transporter solute-binding subunit [Wenxinia marina]|uniref:TRAP transporter solute receptor, TAXI family n=1 Tax=Wenxinia marina DSM 24838 TaxID=1123501 RepID=A0A0D0QBH8_9RHOB|nr:TAXI family TRAP transporter solute-binding subunit [Wenxinia marina]KIQ68288.1 TRAP transporter solute receptor, TAXI family [Wenxinia marina DSM 24838]GGL79458.1 hypothetical protein GCM10011392_37380 [Wenxinia marina]
MTTDLRSLAAALALTALPVGAAAQTIAMATDQPGTTFNTVGSAIANAVSQNSDVNVIVRTYAGPAAWAPVVDTGEVATGVMSANSAYQAYSGENEAETAYTNLRLIRSGDASLQLGMLVRADGPIQSYEDLAGARISSDFGGHLSIGNSLLATLTTQGLTWDDVTPVPVTGANDGIDALVADRLDATWASVGQPRAREADSQIGVRYLSVPNTPENEAIFQEYVFPGARISTAPDGAAPGVIGDTNLLSYDTYVVANADVDDATVTALLEGMLAAGEELQGVHPSLAGFTPEAAVTSAPVIPYHDAAIAFYKEQGMWTDEDQARQDALLAGGTE